MTREQFDRACVLSAALHALDVDDPEDLLEEVVELLPLLLAEVKPVIEARE